MQFRALATDYDGTLAEGGAVTQATYEALARLKASGRRLLLVTGRQLDDLMQVFHGLNVFDLVVAENGALLFDPATAEEQPLAPSPPPTFLELLATRGVQPLSVGRCIVATWEPHEVVVLECIKDLKLELQITFNKGAVMVLPTGINKATGLTAALKRFNLSPKEVVGIGDAENDHAFLRACGFGVAVANAIDTLKQTADMVTEGCRGAGVIELVDYMLALDGKSQPRLPEN